MSMIPQAMYRFDERDNQRVLAWGRNVFWADVECKQYAACEPIEDEPTPGVSFVLMVQWYAALWVAIEGWRQCPLSDSTIDELLAESTFGPYLRLLRRLRNGVYHFQEALIDDRVGGFLREASKTVPWAFLVHSEFNRLLWEVAHPHALSPAFAEELAQAIRGIVGWLPSDIVEAAPYHARHRYREIGEMLLRDGRPDTHEARDLLSAAQQCLLAADKSVDNWTRYKRATIDFLKHELRAT